MSTRRLPRSEVAPDGTVDESDAGRVPVDPRVRLAAAEFAVVQALERRRLYRMHLQASVRMMNDLALDVAAQSGVGPVEVAAGLEPPRDWPWAALDANSRSPWWFIDDVMGHEPAGRMAWRYGRDGGRGGEGKTGAPCSLDDLRFRVDEACIEVEGTLGRGYLATRRGTASLEIPDELPRTLVAALPGRTMNELLGHPLFDRRRYVIRSAEETLWGFLRVVFSTGATRVALPWRDLLRGRRRG